MYNKKPAPDHKGPRTIGADPSRLHSSNGQGLKFDDRRPVPPTLDAIKQGVLQRMAVMTVDNLEDQTDPLVWNNLNHAETAATGPIGDLNANKVWDQLDDNEEIRLVEHGGVRTIGGLSASDIAASMFSSTKKIPDDKTIGGITFQSCYAGVKGGDGSLVTDMAKELKDRNRPGVKVTGRTGIAFGFKGMGEKSAETKTSAYTWTNDEAKRLFNSTIRSSHIKEKGYQAYYDAMWELRDKKTKTTNKDIFKATFKYNTPWEMLDIRPDDWNLMAPEDRSRRVAEEMEEYWRDLSGSMQRKGGFKPDKNAVASAVSKKNGLCFLTSACTEARGLPDDCRELTVLRTFRDGYLSSLSQGSSLIKEYYDIAPQIVAQIQSAPSPEKEFSAIYDQVTQCVSLIENGYNPKALFLYKNMVMRLKARYL